MSEVLQQKWSPEQLKYIQFVARGKTTKSGQRRTDEQFAEAIGVNRTTLWRWLQMADFKRAVLEQILQDQVMPDLPMLIKGQRQKAKGTDFVVLDSKGKKKTLKPDTQAFNALMRLVDMTVPKQVETRIDADVKNQHSGNIGIQLTNMTDDELDKLIEGARNAA